ncbi:putative ribosomal protein S28e [Monocercomonoides exilis]|uniref:putative ribosomal protein S28e n=1 Tax=Monocercomonoides exilis TaxID=2049356 RepID=UPI00355A39F8|nr:putative ribosomal protein S28e [Monocercomonoides exilis]|eukprot:MONOS_6982.1-p1 / transcript=MONOS_6982.1 / gene=MONOS_6982 / organism=Monocercomonoides_exilis_PA203 / gene_product=40S ribosomal protein S28 / transcript_product=40S ribosomal protein S28 / location=Mono_scaffold00230:2346-2667(-) / protein_length=67 / sequence_SO=supercontig / SO=protein_coding / is_pseudo=false
MDQPATQIKYATVVKIIGRTGSRGGITQVRCDIQGENRTITRNIMGPVKLGDVITLLESEREARRLR